MFCAASRFNLLLSTSIRSHCRSEHTLDAFTDWSVVARHANKSKALEELHAWSMLLCSGNEVVGFAMVVWQGTPFSIGLGSDNGLLEEFAESVATALGCGEGERNAR